MSRSQSALSLPLVPASFFGIILGLTGLGSSWRVAHRLWGLPAVIGESLMLTATLVWALLMALYGAKWWLARLEALREVEDPIQCCFIGLVGVATSLIALALLPHSGPVALTLFLVGVAFTFGFSLWRTGRLWRGGRDHAATTPVLYLPTVAGAFVSAIVAGAFGFPDWGQLAFGVGVLSWLGLESVVLHRLYTSTSLAEALRPTLGILLAPPAVGALAYLSVTHGVPGIVEHALIGYALLQALLLLRLLPWIGRQPFAPSYWSFSFGVTALSTVGLRLLERGDKSAITLLALPFFIAANLVIAILVIRTLGLAGRRRLFPALKALLGLATLTLGPGLGRPAIAQMEHMHMGPMPQSEKEGTAPTFAREMMDSMDTMDGNMKAAPMNGDPDHDFLSMMIPHHQGAIDMAKAVLLHGKDPVARRLAQEIIVTQQQEIKAMQIRLTALNMSSPHRRAGKAAAPACNSVKMPPPPYSQDRVYTGDQTSNTVSVIDPATNTLRGIIRLGDPAPGALSPLYRGQLLVHGLGFSPDHKTLIAVSIGSNSVTFIETATNRVKGVAYIGRAPHEAFFTPNGKEVWAAVRGENYISVIDPIKMREIRRVPTANGPGMVLFRPDGRYAFVPSSFTPELDVIDTKLYKVVARVPQASPFSPNLAVSSDGTEVWFTLKDSGKTQVMSGKPPFRIRTTLTTGPLSNHVALIQNSGGKFAYITVGGENAVKVYRRGAAPQLLATIPTGDLPHGIWGSEDGSRAYVGLENQDSVAVIDTRANKVIGTIPVGQQPQALVYVPNAVPAGSGKDNLSPLADAGKAEHLTLKAPEGSGGTANATVSVNTLGPLDLLQMAAVGLKPGQSYRLWLTSSRTAPFADRQPLVTFKANPAGAQIAQTIGPFRQVLTTPPDSASQQPQPRYLLVTPVGSDIPELIQTAP